MLHLHEEQVSNNRRFRFLVDAGEPGRYQIDVSVPASAAENEKMPAILTLDGNLMFDIVAPFAHGEMTSLISRLPPSIVIGVGYPSDEGMAGFFGRRNTDFYGDWDMEDPMGRLLQDVFDQQNAAEGRPRARIKAGGAQRFSEFIRSQLLPALAERFPIDLSAKHTLVGASSAGHYVLRQIYDPQSPFSRFVCISPAFGAPAGAIQELEEKYAASHDDLEATIFVCCGQEEVNNEVHALGRIASGVVWAAEQFTIRKWKSARLDWEIMNNEDHHSVLERGVATGLRSVFREQPAVAEDISSTSAPESEGRAATSGAMSE